MLTVTIPGENINQTVYLECDSNLQVKPVNLNNNTARADLKVTVDRGRLNVTANCKEFEARIAAKDSTIDRLRYVNREYEKKLTANTFQRDVRKVKFVAWYHKASMWFSLAVMIAGAGYFCFRWFKKTTLFGRIINLFS